jgi:hypothetical protein
MLSLVSIGRKRNDRLMRINVHHATGSTMLSRIRSITPTVDTVDRSSSGTSGAPLVPFDERAPTSLELLRQLEDFVHELLENPPRT